jgi:hypothetical protein
VVFSQPEVLEAVHNGCKNFPGSFRLPIETDILVPKYLDDWWNDEATTLPEYLDYHKHLSEYKLQKNLPVQPSEVFPVSLAFHSQLNA